MLIKLLAFLTLVCGFLVMSAHTAPAQSCVSEKALTAELARKHNETPHGMGLMRGGNALVLFYSPGGSWTLVAVTPSGMGCIKASGEAWSSIKKKKTKGPKA